MCERMRGTLQRRGDLRSVLLWRRLERDHTSALWCREEEEISCAFCSCDCFSHHPLLCVVSSGYVTVRFINNAKFSRSWVLITAPHDFVLATCCADDKTYNRLRARPLRGRKRLHATTTARLERLQVITTRSHRSVCRCRSCEGSGGHASQGVKRRA